ncbi:MAG: signal peptide peptidase SppA [Actinomycetota bacterium]|nr:signal peptide peptidase SppA [Actinomycetota bacterium]
MDPGSNPQREPGNGGSGTGGRRRWPFIVGGLVALGLLVLTVGLIVLVLAIGTSGPSAASAVYEEEYISGSGPAKIAVVPIQGTIVPADATVAGVQPTSTPEGLADALTQAKDDESVAAIVLEVNSPGGGVTASDMMQQSILDFKGSSGKPVVVSMEDTAASGGYYISTAADRIVASETTLTGSLGVFIPLLNFREAAEKYGVTQTYIKSGKYKTMGSSWKELTPKEREIFQSIVDHYYDEFVEVIVEGRDLPESRVREIADGRIYSGEQARNLGLVDRLGELEKATGIARSLANVEETTVVRYVESPNLVESLQARLAPPEPEAVHIMREAGLDLEPKPYYLYLPGI